jgi:hypothetical protein
MQQSGSKCRVRVSFIAARIPAERTATGGSDQVGGSDE